ncbi:MAG: 2-hydroxyacyl-CoA dehydratase subunit D [Actinomycetota bacterium]
MNFKESLKKRIKQNLNRKFIRRILFVASKKPVLFFFTRTFKSASDKYLNISSIKSLQKAYSEKNWIAYGSLFLPYELFYSLGLTPFLPEVLAGFTAGMGIADKTLSTATKHWYSQDLCTFHRSASGAVEMDLFPKPKFIICTNLACDAAQKSFYIYAKKYGLEKNFYLIDVPYDYNEKSLAYLSAQLKEISKDIARKTGRQLNPDKFKKIINNSNQFRGWAIKVNGIRRTLIDYPQNFNGLNFILPFHGLAGTRDAILLYKNMHRELKAYTHKQKSNHKKKILWLHLKPYYRNDIFELMENGNCKVVFEEINYVYWPKLDPGNPFQSLAKKMLSHYLRGPIDNRVKTILEMVEDYKIDGAVIFSHWGCRQNNAGARIIKDSLTGIGVPTLILDGDCVDKNNYSKGQLSTRIQGFIEMLG